MKFSETKTDVDNLMVLSEYDSLEEMIRFGDSHKASGSYTDNDWVIGKDRIDAIDFRKKFKTEDEISEALRSLWTDGLKSVDSMAQKLQSSFVLRPKSIQRRAAWSEDNGDAIDLDRMRSGQPFWRTTQRRQVLGPSFITLVISVGANACANTKDLFWAPAAGIAVAKVLEEAGYRVEIRLANYSTRAGHKNRDQYSEIQTITIKKHSDMLDLSTLANVASGWAFRTAWFKAMRAKGGQGYTVSSSLGQSQVIKRPQLDVIEPDGSAYSIDAGSASRPTREGAIASAIKTIKEITGENIG